MYAHLLGITGNRKRTDWFLIPAQFIEAIEEYEPIQSVLDSMVNLIVITDTDRWIKINIGRESKTVFHPLKDHCAMNTNFKILDIVKSLTIRTETSGCLSTITVPSTVTGEKKSLYDVHDSE